jgi:DNA repair protein RecN (Recombination protein N)
MLLRLSIENYALIRKLEMDFHSGFSVITGETGAGKSILLGALGLLLGQRADSSVLLDKSRKCIVEGTFSLKGYDLEPFFFREELDYDNQTIIRREIGANGKSRAFINDSPVTLNVMKELGERLVNIHSQNSITTLNESTFQMAILDQFAGQLHDVSLYKKKYINLRFLEREYQELLIRQSHAQSEHDFLAFLADELKKASLRPGEQEELEQRLQVVTHAEEIKSQLFHSIGLISAGETNILGMIAEVINALGNASRFHPPSQEFLERLRTNQIDLKDISSGLSSLEQQIEYDPSEIETCTARLDLIYHLEKKHQAHSIDDLLKSLSEIESKLAESDSLDENLDQLKVRIDKEKEELLQLASSLSVKRKDAIPSLENLVSERLEQLALPQSRFSLEMTKEENPGPEGLDSIRFLFSANKGIPMDEISRIASGGELSRLMLTLKSLISQKNLLPTIVFDEIDSGVSGDIAGKMGTILQKMGSSMQVLAISHLPQIAGKGKQHYLVYKTESDRSTQSHIRRLSHDERVKEIAKMVSDEKVTDAALSIAKELLQH